MWAFVLTPKLVWVASPYAAISLLTGSVLHQADVSTIGIVIVLALAGLATLRSNVAKIWRENYEAKVEENKVIVAERDLEREKKHAVLTELATAKNQLLVEQAKTDMSPVLGELAGHAALLREILGVLRETTPTKGGP